MPPPAALWATALALLIPSAVAAPPEGTPKWAWPFAPYDLHMFRYPAADCHFQFIGLEDQLPSGYLTPTGVCYTFADDYADDYGWKSFKYVPQGKVAYWFGEHFAIPHRFDTCTITSWSEMECGGREVGVVEEVSTYREITGWRGRCEGANESVCRRTIVMRLIRVITMGRMCGASVLIVCSERGDWRIWMERA